MKQYSTVNNIRIAAIVGLLVVLVVLFFIALGQYQASQEASKKLEALKHRLVTVQADLEATRKSISQLKEEQEDFKKTLFDEQDVPAFLDGISKSASKFLVHVVEMKTQQFSQVTIPKEMLSVSQLAKVKVINENEQETVRVNSDRLSDMLTLASMPIHIKITGTFEAIVRFLNSIENYQQLLTVSNVEIESNKVYPQLTCDFNLRIYSLKKLKDIKL